MGLTEALGIPASAEAGVAAGTAPAQLAGADKAPMELAWPALAETTPALNWAVLTPPIPGPTSDIRAGPIVGTLPSAAPIIELPLMS